MSVVAIIVLVLVAVALAAMLLAGLRRSAAARAVTEHEIRPFRSHAEASRGGEEREHEAV